MEPQTDGFEHPLSSSILKNNKIVAWGYWYLDPFKGQIWHRADGPAYIEYYDYEEQKVRSETYYHYGKKHRTDGPAFVRYDETGAVNHIEYYIDDKLHRIDGPAVSTWNIPTDFYALDSEEDYLSQRSRIDSFFAFGNPLFIERDIENTRLAYDKNEVLCDIILEFNNDRLWVSARSNLSAKQARNAALSILVEMFKDQLSHKLVRSIQASLALL